MNATYRRNITKSRSGHYHLTLIDKATSLRVTGRFGWGHPAQARMEEEAWCAEQLAERVRRCAALSADMQAVANAAADALAND